jgi:hypothetical protein
MIEEQIVEAAGDEGEEEEELAGVFRRMEWQIPNMLPNHNRHHLRPRQRRPHPKL